MKTRTKHSLIEAYHLANSDDEAYFELVKNDFFHLRLEWRLYRNLFGTNEETIELLNSVSGPTARKLQRILFDRVLLGLRKLTDPETSRRRDRSSVTVKGLTDRFDNELCDVRRLVNLAEKASAFAREWSDRKIAHSDLEFRSGAKQLTPVSRQKVEDALEAIAEVIRRIAEAHYNVHQITHPKPAINDERQLLRVLYEGLCAIKERERKQEEARQKGDMVEFLRLETTAREIPAWLHRSDPPMD